MTAPLALNRSVATDPVWPGKLYIQLAKHVVKWVAHGLPVSRAKAGPPPGVPPAPLSAPPRARISRSINGSRIASTAEVEPGRLAHETSRSG